MKTAQQQRIEELEISIAKTYETAPTAADFRNNRTRRAVLREQLAAARAQTANNRNHKHG